MIALTVWNSLHTEKWSAGADVFISTHFPFVATVYGTGFIKGAVAGFVVFPVHSIHIYFTVMRRNV